MSDLSAGPEYLGLAHYTEHAMYMGSKEYPRFSKLHRVPNRTRHSSYKRNVYHLYGTIYVQFDAMFLKVEHYILS